MSTRIEGFIFDAGPTIITVPFVLDELAELAGKRLDDYVTIVPCDPFYRIYFDDGRHFDYSGDPARARGRDRPVQPRRRGGLPGFLAYTEKVFDTGVHRPGRPLVPLGLGDGQGRARPDPAPGRAVGLPAGLLVHRGPDLRAGLLVRAAPDRRQPAAVVVDLLR